MHTPHVKLTRILYIIAFFFMAAPSVFAATNPGVYALYESSLASKVGPTDTSLTLVSNIIDSQGDTLPNGYTCMTLDSNTSSIEYVCGTVSGDNVTGLSRGLTYTSGTTTLSTLATAHARGADARINDYPALTIVNNQLRGVDSIGIPIYYDRSIASSTFTLSNQIPSIGYTDGTYLNLATSSPQFIAGVKTFNGALTLNATTTSSKSIVLGYDPSNALDAVTKEYVDNAVVAGAPNASVSVKGIVQQATTANLNAGTTNGSTGAPLFVNPTSFIGTVATTTEQNFYKSSSSDIYAQIPLTANDQVMIWGKGDFASCGTGNHIVSLIFKQSTFAASTTVDTGTGNNSVPGACDMPVLYGFTATTTETETIEITGAAANSILYQVFGR